MVAQTVNRLASSRQFIAIGLLFLSIVYGYRWLPAVWAAINPPFRSYAVEVHAPNGRPASVVERRDIWAAADATWQVRVVDLTRNEVRCYLPPQGPRALRYWPTKTRSFELSWHDYTGDDGRCLEAMLAHPGTYEIETHRSVWVWWRWVDLPVARSILSFEVGSSPAGTADGD